MRLNWWRWLGSRLGDQERRALQELAEQRLEANRQLEKRYAELDERCAKLRAQRDNLQNYIDGLGAQPIDEHERLRDTIQSLRDALTRAHERGEHERRVNSTLRGHMTRLRKKLNGPTTEGASAPTKGEGDAMLDLQQPAAPAPTEA